MASRGFSGSPSHEASNAAPSSSPDGRGIDRVWGLRAVNNGVVFFVEVSHEGRSGSAGVDWFAGGAQRIAGPRLSKAAGSKTKAQRHLAKQGFGQESNPSADGLVSLANPQNAMGLRR